MLHTFQTKQFLKSDLETIWKFISSPKNLSVITPPNMGFTIISVESDAENIYAGQIIEYYVKPVLGIKMHWVTEITHVRHHEYFVDEQRSGPYEFWHHKHFISELDGGVEMIDIVHYKAPLGFLGRFANAFFIKRKLKTIFDYRYLKMHELFNL